MERAKRRKLERVWRNNKDEADHLRYIEQRDLCAKLSIEKQENFYSKLIDTSSNKQKSLFEVVDKLLDKKDERILPVHTDPVALANEFNEYYIEKIEKLRESIPKSGEEEQLISTTFKGLKLESFEPTTADELREIINENSIKTSSDDPLPAVVLKTLLNK